MTVSFFLYLILYVVATTLIFAVSAFMLWSKTRKVFYAPVPYIHDTLGKLLVATGVSYLIFLPCVYQQIICDEGRAHLYIVVSMLTATMTLSVGSWGYMNYLQQGVRQRELQPSLLTLPLAINAWYAFQPQEWLLKAYYVVMLVETIAVIAYCVHLYRLFVHDLRNNYSNISQQMINAMHTLWAITGVTVIVFAMCVAYDNAFWNIANILVNLTAISIMIYISEHLMPLPDTEVETVECEGKAHPTVHDDNGNIDIARVLSCRCESSLLFCNPNLTLTDLALALGINRTYLGQWFTDNDTTFYQYINTLRVRHAANLLRTTDKPIKIVQTESGFSSRTTFSKYFMEYHDCSPTVYRQKNRDL